MPTLMAAMFSTLMLTSTAAPAVHTPLRGCVCAGLCVARTDKDAEEASGGCLQGAVPACVLLAAAKEGAVRGLVIERLEGWAVHIWRVQHVITLGYAGVQGVVSKLCTLASGNSLYIGLQQVEMLIEAYTWLMRERLLVPRDAMMKAVQVDRAVAAIGSRATHIVLRDISQTSLLLYNNKASMNMRMFSRIWCMT